MKKWQFRISVTVDQETGRFIAAYFSIRKGLAATVREYADGTAFANYDSQGRLIGIELLAPCNVQVINQITRKEPREVRRFITDKAPREAVLSEKTSPRASYRQPRDETPTAHASNPARRRTH